MSVVILKMTKIENLKRRKMKSLISEMYDGIELDRSWVCLMFYPVWLFRRILFVVVPLYLLNGIKWAQIICVLQMQILYSIFYGVNQCHHSKKQFHHHLINETMILLVIYCSISWSDFVVDEEQKYLNGFAYPVILLLTILYNFTYISMELYNNNKSITRKIGA